MTITRVESVIKEQQYFQNKLFSDRPVFHLLGKCRTLFAALREWIANNKCSKSTKKWRVNEEVSFKTFENNTKREKFDTSRICVGKWNEEGTRVMTMYFQLLKTYIFMKKR